MTLHGRAQVIIWECEVWTVGGWERHSQKWWRMIFLFIRHRLQNACCSFLGIWTNWVENQPSALAIFFRDVIWGRYTLCCSVWTSEWWNWLSLSILFGGQYYPWQHILQETVLPEQCIVLCCDFCIHYYYPRLRQGFLVNCNCPYA